MNLICAVALNGIIGDSTTNSIPWYIPSDLKRFKELTTGNTIIMGAKTYNSLGRNLPNRKNVVISRGGTQLVATPDAVHASLGEAIRLEHGEGFIIGGEHIFGESLKYRPKNLFMTIVRMDAQGDVRFPIAGSRLLYDNFVTVDGALYTAQDRSEWKNENGIEYQYVTFTTR